MERTKLQCAARGCPGCSVCATEIKQLLREKRAFGPEDFDLLLKAADRIEQLEKALEEAIGLDRLVDGRRMIAEYLKLNGYDGLYCDECGCELSDLMPCGGEWAIDCVAGYKHDGCTEDCGKGCDFHIGTKRR